MVHSQDKPKMSIVHTYPPDIPKISSKYTKVILKVSLSDKEISHLACKGPQNRPYLLADLFCSL